MCAESAVKRQVTNWLLTSGNNGRDLCLVQHWSDRIWDIDDTSGVALDHKQKPIGRLQRTDKLSIILSNDDSKFF